MVWELQEKMKQIYNLYEQRQPLRGGGKRQNCHGNVKSASLERGEEPGEVCRQSWRLCPGFGESQSGRVMLSLQSCPYFERFSRCWADVSPSQTFSCPGTQLPPTAPGMTRYHWALMTNQQTNYHFPEQALRSIPVRKSKGWGRRFSMQSAQAVSHAACHQMTLEKVLVFQSRRTTRVWNCGLVANERSLSNEMNLNLKIEWSRFSVGQHVYPLLETFKNMWGCLTRSMYIGLGLLWEEWCAN